MFRIEAIKSKEQRLLGKVIVTQPTSIYLICFACFIIFMFIFAYLIQSNYSRKETVHGYLVPEKGLVKVFSNRTGVVANIYVKEGDNIEQGEEIIKIKNSQSLTTGVELSAALSHELSLQIGYLNEELNIVTKISQKDFYRIRRQITQLEKSLLALHNAKKTNKQKLDLKKNQLYNHQSLLKKGHVSQSQIDLIAEQYLDVLEGSDYLDREIASVDAEISALESESISLPEQLILKQIIINRQLSELKSQMIELDSQYEFIQKAPESGVITTIQSSIGNRLDPNSPLLTIIPINSSLEIELLLPTRSAGFVQVKDKINIRFDAFPYQKFGVVIGEISNVDKALILPTDRQLPIKIDEAMYRVRAKLYKQSVQAYGKEFPLKIGMIAEVDIILEKRSLLEWLLDPIYAVKGKLG